MIKNILNTLWDYIKKFAELEKTGPFGPGSFDRTIAKIRLIVLVILMILGFLWWRSGPIGIDFWK